MDTSSPWFLALALLGLLAAIVALVFGIRALRRARAVKPGSWVVLELRGPISEVASTQPRWRRLLRRGRSQTDVAAVRALAERVARDARVAGVVFRIGGLNCGWATASSLREAIARVRASGKRTAAYLPEGGGTREIFVALAAERIFTSPHATLSPLGFAASTTFYRGPLARLGIEAEVIARGEFKSAAARFTADEYSEHDRHQLGALLDALHGAFVRALCDGRGLGPAQAASLIDGASYPASDAQARGLIDGVAYDDEIALRLAADGAALPRLVRAARYLPAAPRLSRARASRRRRVGLVEIRGAIVGEAVASLGRVADARRVVAALRAARADRAVAAVVLYIDSPGGSALASDLIAHEVARLREKKPVVAYFSDTAASGGYYVAAPANAIVAQPLTVTGSIGVIAMRLVFERALALAGATHEVLRRGEHADLTSPYRHWTERERALLEHEIEAFYQAFVGIVARGRGKPEAVIEPLARGRVYAGTDAHAVGLVDTLGGLDAAIAQAAALAGIPVPNAAVTVQPPRRTPDPPEPPAALQPLVARLGADDARVQLALSCAGERIFALEHRLVD